MKKITFLLFTIALFSTTSVMAQFTFPTVAGPTNVASGTPVTLNFNDATNTAGVTAGLYGSATVTLDWSEVAGGSWSNEVVLQIETANGFAAVVGPLNGASSSVAVTLNFDSGLGGVYDPSVDGLLNLTFAQTFDPSEIALANIVVTLNPFTPPTPPSTVATITVDGCGDAQTTTNAFGPSAGGEVQWIQLDITNACSAITLDTFGTDFGTGPDDDTEIGLYDSDGFLLGDNDDEAGGSFLSSVSLLEPGNGTYYIAVGPWNITFGGTNFDVTTNDLTTTGTITVNATTFPANDACVNSFELMLGNQVTGTNAGATLSPNVPACNDSNRIDVWYTFNSGAFTELEILTDAGYFLQVWEGADCNALTQVAGGCGATSIDALAVATNTDYFLQVWSDELATRATGTFSILVGVDALSTESFESNTGFTYYPNPVKNTLSLDAQSNIQDVAIYNMLGQVVLNTKPNNMESVIDTSALQTGTYFVKVTIDNVTETVRVIKQ